MNTREGKRDGNRETGVEYYLREQQDLLQSVPHTFLHECVGWICPEGAAACVEEPTLGSEQCEGTGAAEKSWGGPTADSHSPTPLGKQSPLSLF